ncbi:MAG: HAD-IIA family hydrolase [Mycobacteriales bacterium]
MTERGHRLGSCDRPLTDRYDAVLCDLDGVLYLGDEPVVHAAATVAAARAAGMRFAYVTNNASRAPAVVAEQLASLGIPAEPADVVTSAQAAARMLALHLSPGAAVLVVGSDALADEVAGVGLRPVRTVDEAGEQGPVAVVQGLSQTIGWPELAEAAVALQRGALWVAGNTDTTLPTPRGPLPGNGAFVAALRAVTGREPLVAGKPDPALHRLSMERVGATRPLVVGDRLDTDILGAVRGGADSLLVLTGLADVEQLVQAPSGSRPTYVASDLRGLLEPHPDVQVDGAGARCRGATATYQDGVVRSSDSSDDGLRARVALAWSCADQGLPVALG